MNARSIKGFSLFEMSLVLLIISMMFSAALYSKDLIRSAYSRAVIAEFNQFQQMIENFRTQYGALPGDFANASTVFSSCTSSCNGNGDGIIEWSSALNTVESLRGWQHLSLAGILSVSFPGTATLAGESDIGVNIPASAWPNAGIELNVFASTPSGQTGNGFQIAGFTASSSANTPNIMTPKEAWSIDVKIDDGVGQTGAVLGFGVGTSTSCVGTDGYSYNLSYQYKVCYLRYLLYPNMATYP